MPQVNQRSQKKDPLDTIAKGLQIAGSVYGIYSDRERLKMAGETQKREEEAINRKIQSEEETKQGFITPAGEAELRKQGFVNAKQGDSDSVTFKRPSGEQLYFKIPQKAGKTVDEQVKVDERNFKQENQLRDEYQKLSKNTLDQGRYYKNIENIVQSGRDTGASDMSLVYNYMKLLDPTSVVREGEYATAENTRGVPDTVRMYYNKSISGEKLSPEQRQSFRVEARSVYDTALQNQKATDDQYKQLAKDYGLRPDRVIDKRFQSDIDAMNKKINKNISKSSSPSLPGESKAMAEPSDKPFNPDEYLGR